MIFVVATPKATWGAESPLGAQGTISCWRAELLDGNVIEAAQRAEPSYVEAISRGRP